MDTKKISLETVELLSRLTEQNLTSRDLTPPIVFLASLVTVLLGVMSVDGIILDEEKQQLLRTIYKFSIPESQLRRLTHIMIKGVRQDQTYKRTKEIITLTAPLSESEKLLLIGFEYEIAAADGEIATLEKKYLEAIAKLLGVNHKYLTILEAGFTHQKNIDFAVLDEMRSLLAPDQFQELDNTFVKAASELLALLPTKPEAQKICQRGNASYQPLQEFQNSKIKLNDFCYNLFQIINECVQRDLLTQSRIEELGKVSQKIQSQKFRLAVVGEFSQGKSTLLNALLGEEIQPTREIPCSGAITVLRYGKQKRVFCRYKDGSKEEISITQYQEKASISEEAALGSLSDELARSDIQEIIFEHPELDLCSSGVELVDSPGLNEHPERTAITQLLLKDTDAVIFLTNASHPLTQGERTLILDLQTQLNGGNANKPADNLFIVVNFWDLLRTETGRHQVKQRIKNILQGQNPIIVGENRLHFISAQATLEASLEGLEDEYVIQFNLFTKSIETFLTFERGLVEFKHHITRLSKIIQSSLYELSNVENILDEKLKIFEESKQNILEKIGEASGRNVKLRILADALLEQAIEQTVLSWQEWEAGLEERMAEKTNYWSSEHYEEQKIGQDYANQFIQDLTSEIDDWMSTKVKKIILLPSIEFLNSEIKEEIEATQSSLQNIDLQTGFNLSYRSDLSISKSNSSINISSSIDSYSNSEEGAGLVAGIGGGGLVAGALVAFTGLGLIPVTLIGGVAALFLGGLFGKDEEQIHEEIQDSIFDEGFKKFSESAQGIFEETCENLEVAIYSRSDAASKAIEQIISLLDNHLEQQEKAYQELLEQRETEKAFIAQKRQEIQQIQKGLEAVLT